MTKYVSGSIASVALLALLAAATTARAQQPRLRTLSEQEMIDIMQGSSIQASRSSDTTNLITRVKDAIAQGRTFTMIALEDVPDDWMVVVSTGIGGGGAWQHVRDRVEKQGLAVIQDAPIKAIETLSRHLGQQFRAVVRSEAGGSTLNAFLIASILNVPVVDACVTGRAVPEVQQSIPFINGVTAAPAAMATRWGDGLVLSQIVDAYRLEDLARAVAVSSGGGASLAYNPLSGRELKRVVIPADLSRAITFGRAVREARERGQDPIAALLKVSGGFKLFRGVVTKADMKGERGFTYWDVELNGAGEYARHTYKLWVKNENLLGWIDGVLDAMTPDLIINLDPTTGDTLVGPSLGGYSVGQQVILVSIPAHAMWRTPNGIKALGPRHFGFDVDYVPIEQLQQRRTFQGVPKY